MSDKRLTGLTTATALADDDLFYVVDVSDTEGSAQGTSRKVLKSTITPEWNVVALGADNTGVADSSTAFNAASTLAEVDGGVIKIPPGTYLLSSQWTITAPATDGLIKVEGYGAELTTSGAISALEISGSSGDPNGGVSIYGLKINHRANANATYGFNCDEAWKTRFYDCTVEAHGVGANYAALRCGNSNAADDNTGSFWTHIQNLWVRKRAGADSGDISIGILLEGAANATTIIGGALNHCTEGILMRNQGAQDTVPNGVSIISVDFEGNGDDIVYSGTASTTIAGPRIIGCRAESTTTAFFSIDGVTGTPAFPPYLCGNFIASSVTSYISNTNNIMVTSLDNTITPDISGVGMTWTGDTTIIAEDGSGFPLTVRSLGGGRGIDVENSSGTTVAQLVWTGSGQLGRLRGNSTGQLALTAIGGISETTTDANNLRGQETLSSGTASVTFGTAETDANYYILLSGDTAETFTWASKATSGFTINSSNGSSTATVDWFLVR